MERTRKIINAMLCIGLLSAASLGFAWLVTTKPRPEFRMASASVPRVAVLPLQSSLCKAPIVGYGTVRPKRQVKIIPEVGGRLMKVHEELATGNIIGKGELLFEIDSRVYKSKVAQTKAEVARLEAQLARHDQEKVNLKNRLALALRQAELAKTNLDRDRDLFDQDSLTAPELEASEDRHLRQQDAVLVYESQLAMIPHQIEETTALLTTKRAQLEEAKLNLEKTRIYCPFNARVDSVSAQESQVVISNFQIATLTDMEALEVSVVIDPRDLRWTDQKAFASAIGYDLETAPEARVTWTLRGQEFSWSGKVTRLERLDEVTRSAHLVVEIQDIMLSLDLGKGKSRPPLSVGMFCRTEIPTAPLSDSLLVPRHAIHDGEYVYVFKPDGGDGQRGVLAVKRAPILRSIGEDVLVSYEQAYAQDDTVGLARCELEAGDLIIVSPLPKAIEGMPLSLRPVGEAVARLDTHLAPILHRDMSILGSVIGVR